MFVGSITAAGRRSTRIAASVVAVCLAMPAASLATSPPTIDGELATHLTISSAVLEAHINPEGLETTYSFWIEYEVCRKPLPEYEEECHAVLLGPEGEGHVAGEEDRAVSTALTNLETEHSYTYWLIASNPNGPATGEPKSFRTLGAQGGLTGEPDPPPSKTPGEPEDTNQPYQSPPAPPWVGELAAATSAAATAARQAERASKEQAEHQEALSREERGRQEETSRTTASTQDPATQCLVPALKGDSLAEARSTLQRAHCKLGRVSRTARGHRSALVITRQSQRRGTRLPAGTVIAVHLDRRGPARPSSHQGQ